jgi:hypothetical protein
MGRLGQEHIVNKYLRRRTDGVKGVKPQAGVTRRVALAPAATFASQFLARLRASP